MAYVSGCYRWNDVLSAGNFLFQGNLLINGEAYTAAMIQPAEEDDTDTSTVVSIIFNEESDYYGVYLGQHGWIEAVDPLEEEPVAVKSALWQTWDFGDAEQEIDDESLAFLLENAAKVVSAEAVGVTYGGRLVASLTAGQTATLRCEGKKMTTDVVVTVPEPVQTESSEGAALNLAFGDTAPEDTGKLWVKTAEPLSVEVKLNADFVGNEGMCAGVATLANGTQNASAAAIGSKIYIFGGQGSSTGILDTIQMFDTETNTTAALSATLPKALTGTSAAAVGSKIYIFGGQTASGTSGCVNTIFVFDTETNTISTIGTTIPKSISRMSVVAIGSKIYIIGGTTGSSTSSTIYAFNTESNAITSLAPYLDTSRYGMAAAAVGSKIYIFGGGRGSPYYNMIQMLDTEANTITTLDAVLPKELSGLSASAVGGKIYVFGGRNTMGNNEIYVFDPETNTIATLDTVLPSNLHGISTAAVGNKIYVIGGYDYLNTIHEFSVSIDLPENNLLIEASWSKNMFHLLPNMEIGVKNVYLGDLFGKGKRVAAALYQDGAWVEI